MAPPPPPSSLRGVLPSGAVVSGSAAERLARAAAPLLPNAGGADGPPPRLLRVALLTEPAAAPDDAAWAGARDVHAELALAPATLAALGLHAGAAVEVQHAARTDAPARLATATAAPAGADGGTAWLAPLLAHNLGFQRHLAPFFAPDGSQATAPQDAVVVRRAGGGAPASQRARPQAARRATVSLLRQPADAALPAAGSDDDEEDVDGTSAAAATAPTTPPAPLADAVAAYFRAAPRVLAHRDVFAVPDPDTAGDAALADALVGGAGGGKERALSFFRVEIDDPPGPAPIRIDPSTTLLTIAPVGCAGTLPVGVGGYAAAGERAAAERVRPRSAREPPPPPPRPDPHPPLFDDALAAWAPHPALPGAGPLLPPWRAAARALAPALVHGPDRVGVRAALLITGPVGSGRATAASAAAAALGLKVVRFSARDLSPSARAAGSPAPAAALAAAFDAAHPYTPALLLLTDVDALFEGADPTTTARLAAALDAGVSGGVRVPTAIAAGLGVPHLFTTHGAGLSVDGRGVVLLAATAASPDALPPRARRVFTHEIPVPAPDAGGRAMLLRAGLGRAGEALPEADLKAAAAAAAGLLPADLAAVAADAAAAAASRAVEEAGDGAAGDPPTPTTTRPDLDAALEAARARSAIAVGAPTIPRVKWEDVGGLAAARDAILDTVDLPLRHPSLFAAGGRARSGVLLYGPPGTGKTLLAKAVATECALAFIPVKGPELVSPYVGESEKAVRGVFGRAKAAAPSVLFFDELDALAPARGRAADAGGVMDRVTASLLAEIDAAQAGAGGQVFVIGATNRPDLLDPALLRPGRLDRLVYVGVGKSAADKAAVLGALTRKMVLGRGVDLTKVARALPAGLTGADLYGVAADAWTTAARRAAAERAAGGGGGGTRTPPPVVVSRSDFDAAAAAAVPSLSEEELARYEALRDEYEGKGGAGNGGG